VSRSEIPRSAGRKNVAPLTALTIPAAVRVIAAPAHRKEQRFGSIRRPCRGHETAALLALRRFSRSRRPAFRDLYAGHLPRFSAHHPTIVAD
jgi:hypothetical protein